MQSDTLREGVLKAIRRRLQYRKQNSGVMAFGVSQLALPACALGQGDLVAEMLQLAGETYFNNNLMTTHDPHKIFNTDMSGAYPAIVLSMLAYSDGDSINLLQALPEQWRRGCISGMSLRGGIRIDRLTWDNGHGSAILTSRTDRSVRITVQGENPESAQEEKPLSAHGEDPHVILLKKGVPYTFTF